MELTQAARAKLPKLRAKVKPWPQTEGEEVRRALTKTDGNKALAARLLGIGKQTLYRKLERRS